jgi:hypothetical protein
MDNKQAEILFQLSEIRKTLKFVCWVLGVMTFCVGVLAIKGEIFSPLLRTLFGQIR